MGEMEVRWMTIFIITATSDRACAIARKGQVVKSSWVV